MAILSINISSSLNDQYGRSSFSTLAVSDRQPCITQSDSMLRCSSSIVADLISSAVMQSGMSVHDYGIYGYVYYQYFFISVSWLFLDSRSATTAVVQVCIVLLHCPDGSLLVFLVAYVTSLLHLFSMLPPMVFSLVITMTSWIKQ